MNKKLLIFLIASLILIINVNAAQVCCERTAENKYCQYIDESQCAVDSKKAPTNCIFTSFCRPGCCFDLNDGRCYANMPQASCLSRGEGSSFGLNQDCDLAQCELGCCIIGTEASLITQTRCKKETSKYPDLEMVFKEEIKDEVQCVSSARSQEKGCCVQSSDKCTYTTRGGCALQSGTDLGGTGFLKGRYCSDSQLICDCTPGTKTGKKGCLDDSDDVYYIDSCGNPESIAEDCDYVDKQTTCGFDKFSNNYKCIDLSCNAEYTIKNEQGKTIFADGAEIKNGEAWCEYDTDPSSGLIGFGRDVPGSRYYRGYCLNNKIVVEPCEDYRTEWCIQGNLKIGDTNYNTAACRINRWDSCTSQTDQANCENTNLRDCLWSSGRCLPFISPGFKFWEGEGTDICSQGSTGCKTQFLTGGIAKLLGQKNTEFLAKLTNLPKNIAGEDISKLLGLDTIGEGWTCIANCECLEHDFIAKANNVCRGLGDCGASYNILTTNVKDSGILMGLTVTPKNLPDYIKSADCDAKKSGIQSCGNIGKIGLGDLSNWASLGKIDSPKKWDSFNKILESGVFNSLLVIGLTQGTYAATKVTGWERLSYFSKGFFEPLNYGLEYLRGYVDKSKNEVIKKIFDKLFYDPTKVFGEWPELGLTTPITQDSLISNLKKLSDNELRALEGKNLIGYTQIKGEGIDKNSIKIIDSSKLDDVAKEAGLKPIERTSLGKFFHGLNIFYEVWEGLQLVDTLLADTEEINVKIECKPWQAPLSSTDCEKCNSIAERENKKCSEYLCKSLGQSCVLLNQGTTNESCVSQNPRDKNPPIISVWKDGLGIYKDKITETVGFGYKYNSVIPAYTMFPIALTTNEPAQCKASLSKDAKFDDMADFIGSGLFDYNHLQLMALPNQYSLNTSAGIIIAPGQTYTLYIKCQDSLKNENVPPYTIRFTIQEGPDTTPPVIEGSSIIDGSYILYSINKTNIDLYVNEISECKWSLRDQDYNGMENNIPCSSTPNDAGLYECPTTLEPIIDGMINNFYFRCKDKPGFAENERNVNSQSYKLVLRGSYPLIIDSIAPEKDSIIHTTNFTLRVETSKGASLDGKAYCYYGETQDVNAMNLFYKTNSSVHEQVLSPARRADPYTFNVVCVDYGGNMATASTIVKVEKDVIGPRVTRIYKDETFVPAHLVIILDEPAQCQYSLEKDFTFGDGTAMATDAERQEAVYNKGATYYIRCKDPSNNIMLHIFHT